MFSKFNRIIKKIRRNVDTSQTNWLDRSEPFSRVFELDRGDAIDRVYIDSFLSANSCLIAGSILEFGDDRYTSKYGNNVSRSLIINGSGPSSSYENIDLDLTKNKEVDPFKGSFDCIIATNVLNFIFDVHSAVKSLGALVNENGTVLATVAGCVPVSRFGYERWGDFWRFNDLSIKRIFSHYFDDVVVGHFGNAPLAAAFVMGLSQEEVPTRLFSMNDHDYQILVTVKASRPKRSL